MTTEERIQRLAHTTGGHVTVSYGSQHKVALFSVRSVGGYFSLEVDGGDLDRVLDHATDKAKANLSDYRAQFERNYATQFRQLKDAEDA